jgi:hypothetical protein
MSLIFLRVRSSKIKTIPELEPVKYGPPCERVMVEGAGQTRPHHGLHHASHCPCPLVCLAQKKQILIMYQWITDRSMRKIRQINKRENNNGKLLYIYLQLE